LLSGGYVTPVTTNDGLVLRGNGSSGLLLNYGSGSGGIAIYNGGTTSVASISSAGEVSCVNLSATGIATVGASGSRIYLNKDINVSGSEGIGFQYSGDIGYLRCMEGAVAWKSMVYKANNHMFCSGDYEKVHITDGSVVATLEVTGNISATLTIAATGDITSAAKRVPKIFTSIGSTTGAQDGDIAVSGGAAYFLASGGWQEVAFA